MIVNETLARRMWPGRSPIGQQLRLNGVREVLGVVRDGTYRSLDERPTAYAFIPVAQRYSPRMTIYARAGGTAGAALVAIRQEVAALDRNIAKEGRLAEQLEIYYLPQRAAAWLVGAFGLVRIVLAEGSTVIAIGLAIGFVVALAAGRLAASFLFGVSGADPLTFIAVALILGSVALLASCLPARRAAGVDPIRSLRVQ